MIAILMLCSITSISAKRSNPFPDWSKKSHSDSVAPNYDEIFSTDKVRRIEITIDSSDWAAMWSDLEANLGSNAAPPMMMGGRGEEAGGRMGEGGRMGGAPASEVDFSPIWVECNVKYNGISWYNVGVRFKGNSSLMRAHTDGSKKLSMKLDFDEYENLYPELKNQRFYGFKQINLNSNFNDTSFIREIIASNLYNEFGLAVAKSTPCEVYIDFGEGAQYYGLYTIVEDVDDSVIKSHFADSSGNVYKPEERAGSFAEGTFETSEFYLKSNKKGADYSDVEALYTILNSPERVSNEESWKESLEAIFDVEIFLKWLAVNSTIQNWDTYGNMAHNYYLYNNPTTNKLTWIPWDHNEAFQENMRAYNPAQLGSVGDEWPLIKYIIAVDEYRAMYNNYLREFVSTIYTPSNMSTLYDSYYNLLKGSVYREVSARTYMRYYKVFDESIEAMKSHTSTRKDIVESYLANPSLVEGVSARGAGGMGGGMGGMGGGPRAMDEGHEGMMQNFRGGPPPMDFERGNMRERGEGAPNFEARDMERPMMGGRGAGMQNTIVEGEPLPMENEAGDMPINFMQRRGNIPTN